MEKKLNKPHSINIRIDKPCGLLGVPPDPALIILTNKSTIDRILSVVMADFEERQIKQ